MSSPRDKLNFQMKLVAGHFKADFQSVLRTLSSLFTTFVLFHVRRHKMKYFASTYMK